MHFLPDAEVELHDSRVELDDDVTRVGQPGDWPDRVLGEVVLKDVLLSCEVVQVQSVVDGEQHHFIADFDVEVGFGRVAESQRSQLRSESPIRHSVDFQGRGEQKHKPAFAEEKLVGRVARGIDSIKIGPALILGAVVKMDRVCFPRRNICQFGLERQNVDVIGCGAKAHVLNGQAWVEGIRGQVDDVVSEVGGNLKNEWSKISQSEVRGCGVGVELGSADSRRVVGDCPPQSAVDWRHALRSEVGHNGRSAGFLENVHGVPVADLHCREEVPRRYAYTDRYVRWCQWKAR